MTSLGLWCSLRETMFGAKRGWKLDRGDNSSKELSEDEVWGQVGLGFLWNVIVGNGGQTGEPQHGLVANGDVVGWGSGGVDEAREGENPQAAAGYPPTRGTDGGRKSRREKGVTHPHPNHWYYT